MRFSLNGVKRTSVNKELIPQSHWLTIKPQPERKTKQSFKQVFNLGLFNLFNNNFFFSSH